MYKHILLPTDGSELSERAIDSGIQFARSIGARVTGFCVAKSGRIEFDEAYSPVDLKGLAQLEAASRAEAERYLAAVERKAGEAGVPCDCAYVIGEAPYEEIIRAATEKGCDLIFMASRGKKGAAGELFGSETAKVLTHCKIPVLVFR